MKKSISLFIAIVLLFSTLTACEKQTADTESLFEAAQRLRWDLNLCEDDNFIFYKNDSGIWKYDKSSHQEKQILEEKNVWYIYLFESNLYFMSYEKENSGDIGEKRFIYKLSESGEKQLICKNEDFSTLSQDEIGQAVPPLMYPSFFIYNDIIYIYYYRGGLLKFDPKNKAASVVDGSIGSASLMLNKFYYTGFRKDARQEQNFIKFIDLHTGEQKQIYTTNGTSSFLDIFTFENELYFANENNVLCKCNQKNEIKELLTLSNNDQQPYVTFPSKCKSANLYYAVRKKDDKNDIYAYNPNKNETVLKAASLLFNGEFIVLDDILIYNSIVNEKEEIGYIHLTQ